MSVLTRPHVLAGLTACAGPLVLAVLFSETLVDVGFPLDDAWIHSVYGRELLRGGSLAYNPAEPAAGETSPLWAVFSALAHLLSGGGQAMVPVTKLLGLTLHAATAFLAWRCVFRTHGAGVASASALLISLNPDLLLAAVSGMEVPLATLGAVAFWWAVERDAALLFGVVSFLAPLGRPELIGFAFALPLGLVLFERPRGLRLLLAGALGAVLSAGLVSLRTWLVTGRPLPSTFYAKAGKGSVSLSAIFNQVNAFSGAAVWLVLLVTVLSAAALWWFRVTGPARTAGLMGLAGLGFLVCSCLLVPPSDPAAFYHQRYSLPALAPMLGALPLLLAPIQWRWAVAFGSLVAAIGTIPLLPQRERRFVNDARNIDDVQVAIGRALASADDTSVTWTIDAGAIRYFANGYVVDLMGLNSPQLLTASSMDFLARHPANFLVLLDAWVRSAPPPLPVRAFATSTPYTVTSMTQMGRQSLYLCLPEAPPSQFRIFDRALPVICAATPLDQ